MINANTSRFGGNSQEISPGHTGLRPCVTTIVPARNEEAVIGTCLESLAKQPELAEIVVVNDGSTDRTAQIVAEKMASIPHLRLIEARDVPAGWVGKNHAASLGAREARGEWLLFTDADAELREGAVRRALELAAENDARLVSFSPEQVMEHWYEKALIPFVYCRLAKRFSYEAVNDPASGAAAANGQFLLIRRDVYETIGGHASVAGEVLEDVALAARAKAAGCLLWFGSGDGFVRVRMYQSFAAMWEGWKKNLYLLVGGSRGSVVRELWETFPWIPIVVLLLGVKVPFAAFLGVWLVIFRQMGYGSELRRNHYRFSLILYYIPAVLLYGSVLWASYRSYARGRVQWKGREVQVSAANSLR